MELRTRENALSTARPSVIDKPEAISIARRAPVLIAVVFFTFYLGTELDLGARFFSWAAEHDDGELHELPVAILAAALALTVFALMERHQHRQEVERRRATERKLREAVELAIAANASKTTFLASMSHELRTPLNAILGFSDAMRHEIFGKIVPEQYKAYAEDIQKSAHHLLELINGVLDISKIEAGQYELRCQQITLSPLADDATRLIGAAAAEKNLRVEIDVAPDLNLFVDPQAIRQVLINLLGNAVKFNRTGGLVALRAGGDGHGSVLITVQDTGIGIDDRELTHVFEPFAQTSPHHARPVEGTGLGLSIVKRLVELHGGDIRISSTVGVGTTVAVRLPIARGTATRPTRPDRWPAMAPMQPQGALAPAGDAPLQSASRVLDPR